MDTFKLMILIVAGIFLTAVSLPITRIFLKLGKKKVIAEDGEEKRISVYFLTVLTAVSIVFVKTMALLDIAIDHAIKLNEKNLEFEIFKCFSVLVGLSIVWLAIWYSLVAFLSKSIKWKELGFQNLNGNSFYFLLIEGGLFVVAIMINLRALELLLMSFVPEVNTPFYR